MKMHFSIYNPFLFYKCALLSKTTLYTYNLIEVFTRNECIWWKNIYSFTLMNDTLTYRHKVNNTTFQYI